MACKKCGKTTSRNRGKYCQPCYYATQTGRNKRPRGPWRFFCKECNTKISYGATVCSKCRRKHHKGPMNENWGNFKEDVNPNAGRKRARHRFNLPEKCDNCHRRKPIDRHHIDEDTTNNKRSNILFLCRRCHMEIDGRLDALKQQNKERAHQV